jgi:NhaP-type Na+/H+ or K+/H+ antiporter
MICSPPLPVDVHSHGSESFIVQANSSGYFNRQTEDAVFSNVVDLLFNSAAFIYVGALLPFPDFNNHELGLDWWRLFVLAICILIARRLPAILALYKLMPDIKSFREACFTGWFGKSPNESADFRPNGSRCSLHLHARPPQSTLR